MMMKWVMIYLIINKLIYLVIINKKIITNFNKDKKKIEK